MTNQSSTSQTDDGQPTCDYCGASARTIPTDPAAHGPSCPAARNMRMADVIIAAAADDDFHRFAKS